MFQIENPRSDWDLDLKGSPEDAEAYLAAMLAAGTWTVAEDKTSRGLYDVVVRHVILLRSVTAPAGSDPYLGPESPIAAPYVRCRVTISRATNELGRSSGEASGYFAENHAMGGAGCALLLLPLEYTDEEFLAAVADFPRRQKEALEIGRREAKEAAERGLRYRELAHAAKAKANPRLPAEASLAYVIACLRYWEVDFSGEAINQRSYYRDTFRRLTGREFDVAADDVTAEEIAALPDPIPLTAEEIAERNRPAVYECLECGFRTENPNLIGAGGMSCVRCK